jgi:hypothetical protein
MQPKYSIVVKTNQYAGNFERELCAHLTGMVGECEVGHELLEESITEIFEESIAEVPDDNGTLRPVSLGSSNEGASSQDVVIYFNHEPTKEQVQTIKERLLTFTTYHPVRGLEFEGLELIEYQRSFIQVEL